MSLLKSKIFLPLCLAGILTGYMTAEYIVPRYFYPPPKEKLTTQDIINAIGTQPTYFRQTSSGNYLAGQFAQRHKDWDKASEYINRVLRREEDNPDLQKHSMILAMAAGDTIKATAIAQDVLKIEPNNVLAILFTSVDLLKKKDYGQALTVFNQIDDNNITAFIVPVLKLWAETGQGKFNIKSLSPNSFYAYQVLLAGKFLGKEKEALAFANSAFKAEENDVRDLEKHADAFAVYGEKEKAIEIYDALQKRGLASDDITKKIQYLKEERDVKVSLELPNIKSARDGAALVFQNMANILLREYSDDSATIFAQMALHLNPSLYNSHAIIAQVYQRHERFDNAIESLQKVSIDSDLYIPTQRQIAELYTEQEKEDKAIEILQNLYDIQGDIDALIQIGDIHRYKEDYDSAEKIYTQVLNKLDGDSIPENYWHVLYARGIALERLKKFKEAEDDLQSALKFRPDNPYLLNYLGYSWVDQGVNLEKSLDMIKRAVGFKPNDGYITDSLGWAHYKMGEYESAIPPLERAVELLPYDATINDHLGDTYWKVGRHNEAKFQWQRALNYNEGQDEDLKIKIEKKLISGLTDTLMHETSADIKPSESAENKNP